MVVQTAAQRAKKYREAKRAALGNDAYKASQAAKRKVRRAAVKALKPVKKSVIESEEYKKDLRETIGLLKKEIDKPKLPLPKVSILIKEKPNIKKVRETENCEDLVEQLYIAKKEYLLKQNPPKTIKKSSVKAALNRVNLLYRYMFKKDSDCSNFNWLKDTDRVIKFIKTYPGWETANSRNGQLQAISGILIALDGFESYYNIYSKLSSKGRKAIDEAADENLLSERERKNILPWKTLKNVHKKKMPESDKALISLYTLLPPRRVEDMRLLTLTDKTKGLDDQFNYLRINKKKEPMELIYNRYKTDKRYGKLTIKLTQQKTLKKILKAHITANKVKIGKPVFPTKAGKYRKDFSSYVSKTFKTHSEKKVSVNLLRHSYITELLSNVPNLKKRKEAAKLMSHSLQQQSYYQRVDLGSEDWDE